MIAILSLSLLFISSSAAFDFSRACEQGERVPVVYLQQEPLIFHDEGKTMMSGIMHEIFEKLVEECCNESTRITYEANDSSGPIGDILEKHENYLVLPVGRRSGRTQSVLNRPFISLLRSPGLAVVVMKSLSGSDLAAAIVQSWPVIIFIIMSLALAGMFVWFLDHRKNPEEFPEYFPRGIFEGFWWASVTMTTVGYGDKVPRSVAGRLFAVVWINVGLVILAIFMGIVTTSLTTTSSMQLSHLYGLPTSVVNGSVEYEIAVLYNTETYAKSSYQDVYKSVSEGETALALVDLYSTSRHEAQLSEFLLEVATIIPETISYGVVLTSHDSGFGERISCISNYHQNRDAEIHHVLERYLTADEVEEPVAVPGLGYFDGSVFGYTVYAMLGLFVIVLICGLTWQYKLRASSEQKREHVKHAGTQHVAQVQLASSERRISGQRSSAGPAPGSQQPGPPEPSIVTDHTQPDGGDTPEAERILMQQSAEVLRMNEDMTAFRKNWERKFRAMQEKHKRQQMRLFQLDNEGFETG